MAFSFFKWSNKKNSKGRRRKKGSNSKLNFGQLEERNLLAGIFFDSGSGEVTVSGSSSADIGQIQEVDSTNVRVSLSGYADQDFATSSVSKVVFIGFGGDDTFTNNTNIEGLLLGSGGNDTLIGGSGSDTINGGTGNDELSGNGGADRILGAAGDDTIFGNDGDDSIFGGDGLNMIEGNNGDDFIFGGNDVDHIAGGEGIDQIFGLAGDDFLDGGNGGVAFSAGIGEADLILGLDGNDTFTGGTGLNVFYGGNGNDIFNGGDGENRLHGQNGDDTITGGASADFISGGLGNETINSLGGNDFILVDQGEDVVDAGDGLDFVVFKGELKNYSITGTSTLTLEDNRNIQGTESVMGAERFRFDNGDFNAVPVTQTVTVQPIVVSNNNGSNSSEFFGTAAQEADIKAIIDAIYYQAGVDIVWLNERTYNNTFANVGSSSNRPTSDLNTIVNNGDAAGIGSSNPLVLDLYFVEVSAGFNDQGENVV